MKLHTPIAAGFYSAALVLAFSLIIAAPGEAMPLSLKSQLEQSGVSMQIVLLDRTDGFLFGQSFTDPQGRTLVLAPGFGGKLLVQANGHDIILQRDSQGSLQIIQTDFDLNLALCVVQTVITFASDLTMCESDTLCNAASILQLVSNVMFCISATTVE